MTDRLDSKRDFERWASVGALLFILIPLAVWLRLPGLSQRPMHTDEAVQGWKTVALIEENSYKYDPTEHHGPLLYYYTASLLKLSGASDSTQPQKEHLRLAILIPSILLVFLPYLIPRVTGYAALISSTMLAVSPMIVFYSTYYIQEILFVLFSWLFVISLYLLLQPSSSRKQIYGGLVFSSFILGGVICLKETFVLLLLSTVSVVALQLLLFSSRRKLYQKFMRRIGIGLPIVFMIIPSLLMVFLFYSSFGSNLAGIWDFITSWTTYLERAGGAGSVADHTQPWWFYVQRTLYFSSGNGISWSEWPVYVILASGSVWLILSKRKDHRTLFNSLGILGISSLLFLLYSLIPYKTPWLTLNFHVGFILSIAGLLSVSRISITAKGVVTLAACGALIIFLVPLAQRTNATYFSTDQRNPWVYAHSVPAVEKLSDRIHSLSAFQKQVSNNNQELTVIVIAADYWPLPWYLRDIEQTGYWNTMLEDLPVSEIIVASAEYEGDIEEQQGREYISSFYGILPERPVLLMVEKKLWQSWLDSQSREMKK